MFHQKYFLNWQKQKKNPLVETQFQNYGLLKIAILYNKLDS